MISMKTLATQAIKKLTDEKGKVAGKKEEAMAGAALAALKDFCLQNEEFAKAVVQGGSFADCMKKVAAGTGSAISDLEVYKKAVQFYFPGAEVHMHLTIELTDGMVGKEKLPPAPVEDVTPCLTLNLADYF